MKFFRPTDRLPPKHEVVLVRGWGEKKKHYVWAFGEYIVETACAYWRHCDPHAPAETVLWFEPVEWAFLPKPHERR